MPTTALEHALALSLDGVLPSLLRSACVHVAVVADNPMSRYDRECTLSVDLGGGLSARAHFRDCFDGAACSLVPTSPSQRLGPAALSALRLRLTQADVVAVGQAEILRRNMPARPIAGVRQGVPYASRPPSAVLGALFVPTDFTHAVAVHLRARGFEVFAGEFLQVQRNGLPVKTLQVGTDFVALTVATTPRKEVVKVIQQEPLPREEMLAWMVAQAVELLNRYW